jgi:hypothetical protein
MRVTALSLLLVTACATAGDEGDDSLSTVESGVTNDCPTAPEGNPSLWSWHTTRQLQNLVWSSDGKQIGAVDLVFEQKKSWYPWNDNDKRKFCHQVSIRDAATLAHVKYVGPMYPEHAGEIMFMQPAAYFTVMTYVRNLGGWDFHRIGLDGSRTLLAHTAPGCLVGRVLPSPNGQTIAYIEVTSVCDGPGSGSDVVVRFMNATTGATIATSAPVHFAGTATETWMPSGQLVLTDASTAVRLTLTGSTVTATTVGVPSCTDPGTTSSAVRADGKTVGFDGNGKPAFVGMNPTSAFGCQ